MSKEFTTGVKQGIPIGLGYLSVSFAFGVSAVLGGIPILSTILISMINVTSAGQLAGVMVITTGGTLIELFLGQLVINLRYALMSTSLSQKVAEDVNLPKRLFMSFGITDEIYAVAISRPVPVTFPYFVGLMFAPYFGWTLGTALGALFGNIAPTMITAALGVALYAMFVAIVVPPAKHDRKILFVVLIAIVLSLILAYTPVIKSLPVGIKIIICAVVASIAGAIFWPVEADKEGE